jgi:hypothetical protein
LIGLPLTLVFGADVSDNYIKNKDRLEKQERSYEKKCWESRSWGYLINCRVIIRIDLGTVQSNWMSSQMKLPFRPPRVV